MKIIVWIVQVLLALAFLMAGLTKALNPLDGLAVAMPWVGDVPPGLVRFTGVAELVAAVGLILPAVTRIRPGLVPLAASGLALVMVLATVFHASRGEMGDATRTGSLLVVAFFVAWSRWKIVPIQPRAKA